MRQYGSVIALALAVLQAACRADFVDERPLSARQAGTAAEGPEDLLGADLAGLRFGVLARGDFTGRAGHLGVGGASLVRLMDGRVELRFDALFATSHVQGPVVVLSGRTDLGTMLDPVDQQLGTLRSFDGEQSYPVRGGDRGRRSAFVYCVPYGLEVARALLRDEP